MGVVMKVWIHLVSFEGHDRNCDNPYENRESDKLGIDSCGCKYRCSLRPSCMQNHFKTSLLGTPSFTNFAKYPL